MSSVNSLANGGDGDVPSETETTEEAGIISWQEKLEKAREFKAAGNGSYMAKSYSKAVGKYHRALLYIKGIESSQDPHPLGMTGSTVPADCIPTVAAQQEVKKMKMDCYNNLAACLLQSDDPQYKKIVLYCDNVLEVAANVKAMYRKGVALYHLRELEQAQHVLKKAHSLPDGQKDVNIRKYLKLCDRDLAAMDQKMKRTYQAMFASTDASTENSEDAGGVKDASSCTDEQKTDPP